ncbi:MAG TPA: tetratricopeptide repeat protein [Polyangiales bacterium]|nr:tetratricopeptide repeat protein [Polyangiales bacterium]
MADRERNAAHGGADVWVQRLARNPADREAYVALHAHYRAVRDIPSLVNLVAGLAEYSSDAATSSRAFKEAGDIAEQELRDEPRAEAYYRHALARDPRYVDASESLQALLERGARWVPLQELLDDQIERLTRERGEPERLGVLLFRMAELLRKQHGSDDEALAHYQRAYQADPNLLRAIYEARMLLLKRGDLRAACELYEREAAGDPDVARKIALLRELAGRYRELSDLDRSVSALERAAALDPSDVSLTHALATELVQRSATVDERVRALDLDRVGDLLCDIAQSVGPVEGRVFLAAALGHAPWHHRALFELERITEAPQRGELARHWVAYLTHNPDGDLADERRIMLARAYQQAGQTQDAIYALTPAGERGNADARTLLDELQVQLAAAETGGARSRPVAEVAQPPLPAARVAEPDSEEPASVEDMSLLGVVEVGDSSLGEVAAVRAAEDDEPEPPAEHEHEPLTEQQNEELQIWHAQLMELQRANKQDDALAVAERILKVDPLSVEAFSVAERHYRRNRDFARRADLLLRSARRPELPDDTRVQRVREAISLFESRLNDVDQAILAYRELLSLLPDNDDTLRSLIRLLERSKRWDDLVVLLEQSLMTQAETAAKTAILRRLTEIHRRERKDSLAASKTLSLLLDLDPEDRQARNALTDELLGLGRWAEAAELIDRRIRESISKAEQVPLLRQLGELYELKVGDREAAYHTYERLLDVVPNDAAALEHMEAIDEASASHERLLNTLNRRLEVSTPAQAASLLVRMATIAEADLLDQDRACEFLERALQRAPNNVQIATALGNLYERAERYPELLALLRERATLERQGKARAEIYRRIARLLAQQLDDPRSAAEAYVKVNEQGDDHEAWMYLADRARDAEDETALAQALARLAPLETTAPAKRAVLFERAALLPNLGRPADAVEPLVQILTELDPNDADARSTLGALCESLGDYRGLSRVLEAQVARAEEAPERATLARELAELYASKLPDEARAIRALTIWAKATPHDPEPLRRLAEQYERKRRYKELLETLDALAQVEPEKPAQARALEQGALLAQARLKDDAGAFARLCDYTQRFRTPLSAALLDLARRLSRVAELCDLCEQEQRYDEFFALLRERISLTREPAEKIELYRRMAAALIEHRQDDDGALAAYEGLLTIGDDSEALRFVQSWAMRHDDPERLATALHRLAYVEGLPEERRDLLYERGRLLLTRLERPADAIAAFEEAAAVDPNFAPALDELASACESAGDHVKLAQTIERQLAHDGSGHDRLTLVRRLAELYEGPAADDKRAAHTLTRWAELDLASPEPLRRLRKRQERGELWPELLRTLDSLAERERDEAARIEVLVAAGLLAFERFGDVAGSFERLAPLVALENSSADAALIRVARGGGRVDELFDLLERAERWADLVEQLEFSARTELEPERAKLLLRRAARILHAQLRDDTRAGAAYARLLALGEDAEALRFVQARALESDDPRLLADALLRLSQLEQEPRELRDLLFEYAHAQNRRLGAPVAAIPVLQRILTELDPDFEPALDELVSAAQAAGDDAVLALGLERQLLRESDRQGRAALAERLAALYDERLHDTDALLRALDVWAREDLTDVVPRRKLRAVLEAQHKPTRLLTTLDEIARLSDSQDERLDAERAAANLCSATLQDPEQAFERALRLARTGTPWAEDLLRNFAWQAGRLAELTQYYAESERHDEMVELLRQRAARETDPERRAQLLLSAARTLAERVGDELGAAEVYREVLEVHEDAGALGYLRQIAERNDDAPQLALLLQRLAALTSEPAARRDLLLHRAELMADELAQPTAAITLLREVLQLDPSSAAAARALVEIAERSSDSAALCLGLETELSLARGPNEHHALSMRLADLYETELSDPDRAAQALRIACLHDPDDLEAQRRLRVHLERQAAFTELVQALDVLSRIEDTQQARDAARLAAARCLFERLEEPHSALVRLAPLIQAADREAEQLADLVCKPALARELAAVYIMRAKQSSDTELSRISWQKVAQIHEDWLGEPAEAFEASLRLLANDTENPAFLNEVDRLAKKTLSFARLSQIYTKLVRDADDDETRGLLLRRLATILENEASEPAQALEQLMAASRIDPSDAELLEHIERLAAELGSHTELLWAKEQKALIAARPEDEIEALLEVARTADLKLRDREHANAMLRRALELVESAPELHAQVMRVAAELDAARPELGKEDAQRGLLRAHLALAESASSQRRAELVIAAYRWASETLHDAGAGFDLLRVGSSDPPILDPVLEALESSAAALNRLDALNAHLARVAERADPEDKRALLRRRARILEERLKRYDQAAQAYERLLEIDPDDTQVEARHFACLKQAGRYRELLQALERRLRRSSDIERRTALMREIARVWEVDLKNRASAAMVWGELQTLLPQDPEVEAAIARLSP